MNDGVLFHLLSCLALVNPTQSILVVVMVKIKLYQVSYNSGSVEWWTLPAFGGSVEPPQQVIDPPPNFPIRFDGTLDGRESRKWEAKPSRRSLDMACRRSGQGASQTVAIPHPLLNLG